MAQQKDHIGDVNKMMTAVEWLYERFLFAGYAVNSEWKEQAKQMEKEQIIDAFDIGTIDDNMIGNEYYNETYGK